MNYAVRTWLEFCRLCKVYRQRLIRNNKKKDKRHYLASAQSYIHQVLQTIQMKLILLCVWAEPAVLGSAKTALKFKYKIQIG